MIICITSQEESIDAQADPRFGRCAYFVFYNTETEETEFVRNPNTEDAGGVGVKAGQFVIDKGAEVVISHKFGPNAENVLNTAGIEMKTHDGGTVRELIEAYRNNSL
ncbi:MAG: NifB/NifX family molybdenum-iron cluster-binding protein [Spirochaetales bacterium]|nr:NifB/NifX family molybdenum-iron cluster-binding protein [Spirochaetales bacterium]MCF7937161.1 NifB/NifX family molybdenum-iron cluster-binding protein [Spirochaetales bacterium]